MQHALFALIAAVWSHLAAGACLQGVWREEISGIRLQGQSYSFPLAFGAWSSAGPVAEILRILLEEEMRIPVERKKCATSTEILKQVTGCMDAQGEFLGACPGNDPVQMPGAWAGVEVWDSTQENRLLIRRALTAPLGYSTMPGLYTQKTVIERAYADGVMLQWWESYKWKDGGMAQRYFTTVTDLDAQLRNLNFSDDQCLPGGHCLPGTIRPLCDPSDTSITHKLAEMGRLASQCRGGWWYSKLCDAQTEACIPVVLGEFHWNFIEWCEILQDLPVAVTWVGWWQEQQAVTRLSNSSFLSYWWQPDNTFLNLQPDPPLQVYFDDRNLKSFSQQINPLLVLWPELRRIAPDVWTLLRSFSLADEDLEVMMLEKAEGNSDEEIACRWLLNNTAEYQTWLPDVSPDSTMLNFLMGSIGALVSIVFCTLSYCIIRTCRKALDLPRDWLIKWVGPHTFEKLTKMAAAYPHCRRWVVNASPFEMSIVSDSKLCSQIKLEPWSYCNVPSSPQQHVVLVLRRPAKQQLPWHDLPERADIEIVKNDWQQVSVEDNSLRYDSITARKQLPNLAGHLRVAKGPRRTLLMCWSPPPILRGVPMAELDDFLCKVSSQCKQVLRRASIESVVTDHVKRTTTRVNPNMYNALRRIIIPEAACVDASYAEVHTDYGPAHIFISHVWAEAASNTSEALCKFHSWIRSLEGFRKNCREVAGDDKIRAWFCTVCNNQSRVQEELGVDVLKSPFAQVLRSTACTHMAMVSPLQALNRKWCNFEFCLAKHEDKPVWMLTTGGVVQAGHVAPKTLQELARKVVGFHCRAAQCSSPSDEELIDAKVAEMGGYDELDIILKDVFRAAITEAHTCLEEALDIVWEEDDRAARRQSMSKYPTLLSNFSSWRPKLQGSTEPPVTMVTNCGCESDRIQSL